MRTKGHAANGGLQGDSIGELYPLAIVVYGDGHGEVHNIATGERLGWAASYRNAWALAKEIKLANSVDTVH